jgi:hypothetical protein
MRDPNAMIGGSVYALTTITAVLPGRELLLRERVRALREPYSPFTLLQDTHFARLVVLDRLAFEGPPEAQPPIGQQFLLFSATFDGTTGLQRDAYLERMCSRVPAQVESVFGLCAGAPRPLAGNPALFRAWLVGHQVKTHAFFAHRPRATVAQIRAARALSDALRGFERRTRYARPEALQREFEQAFGRP